MDVWETDYDLIRVRHLLSESFRQQWEKGIQAYIAGNTQTHDAPSHDHDTHPHDTPSHTSSPS